VAGVDRVLKWQWFGGYYLKESNFFAQFAIDPEHMQEVYPEMDIVEGSYDAFRANRRGCIIGRGLADSYGFKLGDVVPIIPTIFPHPDGAEVAWQFEVEAIYEPKQRYFDAGMMLFQWDYFQKTLEAGPIGTPGCGTYVVQLEDADDDTQVMAAIDQLFENGPQRVQTTTEAEFQKQFVSMMGNVPFFVSTIGGGVLLAILLAVVNTMLMAGREQTHDLGILKALGFGDGSARVMLLAQSLFLCLIGGGLGLALAAASQEGIATAMGASFPGYNVLPETYALGGVIIVVLGLLAGIAPAVRAGRLRPVDALSSEE